jgi:hypothetical protein
LSKTPANPDSKSINEFSGADKMARLYDDSVPIERLARESGAGTKAKDGQNGDRREKVEGLGSASREIGAKGSKSYNPERDAGNRFAAVTQVFAQPNYLRRRSSREPGTKA